MKSQHLTSNFSAGEFSPKLRGRTDIEKFNAAASKLENVVVLKQGGATMRPSMDFKVEVKTSANLTRLIEFVYSRTDAFVLEFGNLYMRVLSNGALVETSPGVPFELVTPYTSANLADLGYVQGGDTLILFHPTIATRRVRRFAATSWLIDDAPFDPPALYEFGHASQAITMTLSAATVGAGRTATASAAIFLASDVGRVLTSGAGSLTVTAFTSTTIVTGTITAAFVGTALSTTWRLQGSPLSVVTPSAATPVGATITLTAAVNAWRNNVGALGGDDFNGTGYVEINGGLVKLTTFTSALIANGIIIRELTGVVAAPADAWVLRNSAWNVFDGYPRTGTLLQQRLWLGGSNAFPLSFWGSRSALFFDFLPGTLDDSAVYKTIDTDDNSIIAHLVSGWGTLIVLSYGVEFDVRGGIEKPITQANAQITKRSKWGASACRPEEAGTDFLFVERSGAAIRSIFKDDVLGFATTDESIFSDHLVAAGIVSLSYEQRPNSVVWCATTDGKLLAMTFNREQAQVSLCSGAHDGAVESMATIPEGAIDATYLLMRRTINGVTRRYIERLNWTPNPGMDSRKEVTGTASLTWPGFSHLALRNVVVLADGIYMGVLTVSAGGIITLPRLATTVAAGLAYTATITLPAPEVGSGTGTAQGQAMSTNRVWVRFLNTIGCKSNLQELGFQQFDGPLLDVAPTPFTGVKTTTEMGWLDGDSDISLTQDLPYPFTVLNVIRSLTVNAG